MYIDFDINFDFDIDKLEKITDAFYDATGKGFYVTGSGVSYIRAKNDKLNSFCTVVQQDSVAHKRCYQSDKDLLFKCIRSHKTERNICHCGLLNIGVPVIYDDEVICVLALYDMKEKDATFDASCIEGIGLD